MTEITDRPVESPPPPGPASAGRPLRVMVMVDGFRRAGGAERVAVALATHYPSDRCQALFCATRVAEGSLADELAAAGVPLVVLGRRRRFDVLPFVRLWRILRTERIDVLHTHKFGSNVWGTLVGTLAGVPTIVAQEHTWNYEGQRLRKLLDRHVVARLADAFVAISSRDAERMVEIERVPARKIVLMPNAFVARGPEPAGDLRAELGLPPGALVVGTVAVMRPQKALDVLIDAFAAVAAAVPEAHLVIAGDGPERAALERRAAASPAADRIVLAGWREDLGRVLRTFDVAAMSSDFEGSPLFALECMAHGVPLVSTDVGSVRDVLEDGRSVLLVPPRRPAELAAAIEGLLASPARRQAVAGAAASRLPEYGIHRVASRFADLYAALHAGSWLPARR